MTKINGINFDFDKLHAPNKLNEGNPFNEMKKGVDSLVGSIQNIGFLMVASSLTKTLFTKAVEKFLEPESLPAKINYVDWWPRTCQKTREFVSKFWARRVEGATAASFASAPISASFFLSGRHPIVNSFWNLAETTTTSTLESLGFNDHLGVGKAYATMFTLPGVIGLGTALTLGSYDVVSKYFDKDRVFETKPIFHETLQTELDEILATAQSNKNENEFLQNLLLYGPPGTGKTMVSKWIASNSKMNYIFMSGGDLLKSSQAGPGGAVATLQKLIERAKSLSSPTVIFIDEAEACLGKRDAKKSQELISLLNAFLELTGQPTSKMMLILATNRPDDIDSAVLSRMDYKIFVGTPGLAERKSIIQDNIDILIKTPKDRSHFTSDLVDHIAKQTDGFSGRDIFKLINRLKVEARQKRTLDATKVDQVIERIMKQEKQIETQKNSDSPLQKNPFYQAAQMNA